MEERLGSIVTAPTATSSSWWIGLLLAPQLSDPIHRKWPTRLALLVALRTPLQGHLCVNLERAQEECENIYYTKAQVALGNCLDITARGQVHFSLLH